MSEALVNRGAVKSIICSDYDEHAVDALYLRLKPKSGAGVTPLLYNVMMPDPIRCDAGRRLAGDVVIALALSHHLLLTQGYLLDAVLERIALHGRRYMIIEFMPKGLWDGKAGKPVPDGYSREWFEKGLARVGQFSCGNSSRRTGSCFCWNSTTVGPRPPLGSLARKNVQYMTDRRIRDLVKQSAVTALSVANAYPVVATPRNDVESLIRRLHPRMTDKGLIRLGPAGDGGYLVPDDLDGIEACFSPGVGDLVGFERDCLARGMRVFMADRVDQLAGRRRSGVLVPRQVYWRPETTG